MGDNGVCHQVACSLAASGRVKAAGVGAAHDGREQNAYYTSFPILHRISINSGVEKRRKTIACVPQRAGDGVGGGATMATAACGARCQTHSALRVGRAWRGALAWLSRMADSVTLYVTRWRRDAGKYLKISVRKRALFRARGMKTRYHRGADGS